MIWALRDSWAITRRDMLHWIAAPAMIVAELAYPIMFVLLFAYVFGGVIAIPGGDYTAYLIGGVLVQTLAFGMMGPGVSIATDLGEGIVDRVRSLPASRSAYLIGHFLAELGAALLGLVVLVATGFAVGWSIDAGVGDAIAGFALLILFAAAMIWLGTLIGVVARSPDAVQGIAFITVFPLTFLSNAFVPAEGLPDGLQQVAEWNPVSAVVAGVRTLFGNPTAVPADAPWPLAHPVLAAVLWSVALLAIAAPLCIVRFRRRTTE